MRIRTIKPEFWESESLSKVSREARLLFVGLFSCCDDHGRTRGNSRILASRLYPYDEDALSLLEGWLSELESIGCIRRYVVDGETFLDIPKWLSHQKIDKPSKSKLPEFVPGSRNDREDSRGFAKNSLGTGNREQGTGNGNTHKVSMSLPPAVVASASGPEESRFEESDPEEAADPPLAPRDPDLETEPPPGMAVSAEDAFRRTPIDLQESLGRDLIAGVWEELRSTGWQNRHGLVVRSWGAHIRSVGPLIKKHILKAKTEGKGLSPKMTSGPKSVGELLAERIIRESKRNRNGESGV
jgi:hypothetical protein